LAFIDRHQDPGCGVVRVGSNVQPGKGRTRRPSRVPFLALLLRKLRRHTFVYLLYT